MFKCETYKTNTQNCFNVQYFLHTGKEELLELKGKYQIYLDLDTVNYKSGKQQLVIEKSLHISVLTKGFDRDYVWFVFESLNHRS